MATNHRLWTRNELIIAFNLYCKIPFGQIDARNPVIIALAEVLGRTPGSLSWKLANFARLDPAQHLVVVRYDQVATFLLKKTPFSPEEVARLRRRAP